MDEALTNRSCGSCTMCCKLYDAPEIPKKAGQWCQHCAIGKGCKIYDARPQLCRDFLCLWMQDAGLPEDWKPDQSKMIASISKETGFVHIRCDPSNPNVWRGKARYAFLRDWAKQLLERGTHLLVLIGEQAFVIMPDQDVPLGKMNPDHGFILKRSVSPMGVTYDVSPAP